MSVITTGNFPKALEPGLFAIWGREYEEYEPLFLEMFDKKTSGKNYEEMMEATGFGFAPVKSQGASTTYESEQQGTVTKATHVAYSLGFVCTKEELDDNLYEEVAGRRTEALAFSARSTKEQVAANVYNRAFNSSYTFGDGKELIATDHPSNIGDQSNKLAVDADLSEASLEDMCILIRKTKNTKGHPVGLQARKAIVAPQNEFEIARILKSTQQSDTANNAINALRATNSIPEGYMVNPYLTDGDAFFLRTNAPSGMTYIERTKAEFSRENDFDTENMKYKFYERYSFTAGDWRGIFGTPGA